VHIIYFIVVFLSLYFLFFYLFFFFFFFSSRRRHTRFDCDWSSDVCSSDLITTQTVLMRPFARALRIKTVCVVMSPRPRSSRRNRSEERRVGKECRSRWEAYD